MSDTPRTDAKAYDINGFQHEGGMIIGSHFCRQLERELNAANARITTIQAQLDQRWEMMRSLEAECGTKDVAEAVNFINGLKARYGAVEKFADELAECASQIGWTSSENVTWIRRAESAVSAYRKAKGQQ